ncbi:MAG TPA: hypothetical protein VNE38_08090 [Ktedonobacteraceae bacterium]|nr:hypothetical protein [Ktedonobacteraceae bacterium]
METGSSASSTSGCTASALARVGYFIDAEVAMHEITKILEVLHQ